MSFNVVYFQGPPPPKRGRSSEDFLMFCKMILDYENYDHDGDNVSRYRHTSSPLSSDSMGSQGESSLSSFTSDHDHGEHGDNDQHSDDTETDNGVTGKIIINFKLVFLPGQLHLAPFFINSSPKISISRNFRLPNVKI